MKKLLFALLTLQSSLTLAHQDDCDITKANKLFDTNFNSSRNVTYNLSYMVKDKKTESTFNKINQNVYLLYSNQAKKHNAKLAVNELWTSKDNNAYAMKLNQNWTITMHGELYRHPYLTHEAYALVVCHEMGHLLGGAPYNANSEKTSVEGQADLWAIGSCFPRYINVFGEETDLSDKRVLEICRSQNIDLKTCYKSTLAAESLARTLAHISSQALPVLNARDNSLAKTTLLTHPASQCRLDTFMNGIMCDVSDELDSLATIKESSIATTPLKCKTSFLKNNANVRPSCWFNEKAHNIETKLELYANKTGKLSIKYIGHLPGNYKVTVEARSKNVEFYSSNPSEEYLLFPNTQNLVISTFRLPSKNFRDTMTVKVYKDSDLIYTENVKIN